MGFDTIEINLVIFLIKELSCIFRTQVQYHLNWLTETKYQFVVWCGVAVVISALMLGAGSGLGVLLLTGMEKFTFCTKLEVSSHLNIV